MINGTTVAEVTKWVGNPPVTLDDFVVVGTMKPTAAGLLACQSDDYALSVHRISEGAMAEYPDDPEEGFGMISVFTALRLCANSNGMVETNDDDLAPFVTRNHHLLARLSMPAWLINYPGAVEDMRQRRALVS